MTYFGCRGTHVGTELASYFGFEHTRRGKVIELLKRYLGNRMLSLCTMHDNVTVSDSPAITQDIWLHNACIAHIEEFRGTLDQDGMHTARYPHSHDGLVVLAHCGDRAIQHCNLFQSSVLHQGKASWEGRVGEGRGRGRVELQSHICVHVTYLSR